MADDLDVFYWDSCIFYEILRDEPQHPLKKLKIQELLEANGDHRNRICTSTITHIEVLPKKLGSEAEIAYWDYFSSLYFFDIEVTRNIVELSRELRDFYYKPPATIGASYKLMSTGDSIQLATAIVSDVTEFHTRDKNNKKNNIPLVGLDLVSPNGKLCGKYELKIVDPTAEQGRLELVR